MQYNLRVARSEGADARARAEAATASHDSIKQDYESAQAQSKEATEAADTEISRLLVSHPFHGHCCQYTPLQQVIA